jgi:hypothetical protein
MAIFRASGARRQAPRIVPAAAQIKGSIVHRKASGRALCSGRATRFPASV